MEYQQLWLRISQNMPAGGGKDTYLIVFFLEAIIKFNLPPVRLCDRKDVCKCDSHTCLHKWWTTRGDSARGDALFQKIFTLVLFFQDFWFGRRPFIGELTAVVVTRWNAGICGFESVKTCLPAAEKTDNSTSFS